MPARRRPSAEDIAWVGLLPAALLLALCLLALAHPVSHLIPGPSHQFFREWQMVIRPEPLEKARFLFALIAPFALAGAVLLGTSREPDRRFDPLIIALQAAALGLGVWGALNQADGPYFPFVPDAPGYFDHLLLSYPVLAGGALVGGALTTISLRAGSGGLRKRDWESSGALRFAAGAAAVVLTAVWLLPAIATDSNISTSGLLPSTHIPVAAQDYFAVVNGRTPMVDYVAQYAQLLPLAVAPLLSLSSLSITSFTTIMAVLSGLSLLAVFGVFRQVTERPLAALALYLPFLAISLFPWAHHGDAIEFNGNYNAFFPDRYLGPFVVAWLCAMAMRKGKPGAPVLFLVAGLALLNNVEFGSVCLISLAVALVIAEPSPPARTVRRLLPGALVGLAVAIALVSAVTLIRAGGLPDPGKLTYFSRIFGRESYGAEPMPALGLHIWLYLTFAAAIVTAAVRRARSSPDRALTGMLAFSGMFGLLAGAYFAGRSLPWQLLLLFPTWGLAGCLLAWTAYLHLREVRPGGDVRRAILPAFASFTGFGVMVAAIATTPAPWIQLGRLNDSGPKVMDVPRVQRFVDEHTRPGEAILLYGGAIDQRVAERAGARDVSPWNSGLSLFGPGEYRDAVDALADAGGSKVFLRRIVLLGGLFGPHGSVTRLLRADGFRPVAEDPAIRITLYERPRGVG